MYSYTKHCPDSLHACPESHPGSQEPDTGLVHPAPSMPRCHRTHCHIPCCHLSSWVFNFFLSINSCFTFSSSTGKHRYFCRMRTLPSGLERQVYLLGKDADSILKTKGAACKRKQKHPGLVQQCLGEMFYCKSRISTGWWKGTQGLQTPPAAGLSPALSWRGHGFA